MVENDDNVTKENVEEGIKNFFGECPVLLAKFTSKEEYAKDIINGNLYMNNVKYYRALEENGGKKGQGDKNEMVFVSVPEKIRISNRETKEDLLNLNGQCKYLKISYKEDEDILLYCLSSIKINNLQLLDFVDNGDIIYVEMKLNYTEEQLKQMEDDFGKFVLVTPYVNFIDKVNVATNNEKIPLEYGNVRYVPKNSMEWAQAFANGDTKRFLFKDSYFEYQNEFRIVTQRKNGGEHYLKIGALNDSIVWIETKDLSKMEIKMNFRKKEQLGL